MKLSDEKLREVVIELRPPTALDPLRCHDGEVEGGRRFFPEDPDAGIGDGDAGSEGNLRLDFSAFLEGVNGTRVICMHRIDATHPKVHAILQYPGGRLRYVDIDETSRGVKDLSYIAVGEIRKGVSAGEYLIFGIDDRLLFARWDRVNGRYIWLGDSPEPPPQSYTLHYMPLLPYSSLAGEMPLLRVDVPLADDDARKASDWLAGTNVAECPESVKRKVRDASAERFALFLEDVRMAGYHYSRFYACMAWQLEQGRLWNPSSLMTVGQDTEVQAVLVSSVVTDGLLRLTLQLSRSPFTVESRAGLESLPEEWDKIIKGVAFITGSLAESVLPDSISDAVWIDPSRRGFTFKCRLSPRTQDSIPALPGLMTPFGRPSDIVGIGGRLFSIYARENSAT